MVGWMGGWVGRKMGKQAQAGDGDRVATGGSRSYRSRVIVEPQGERGSPFRCRMRETMLGMERRTVDQAESKAQYRRREMVRDQDMA